MMKILFVIITFATSLSECLANPPDDCTLQHMAGVTSDAAAKFIRKSRLGKTSSIPIESLKIATKGGFGTKQYSNGNAFYMTIENDSA